MNNDYENTTIQEEGSFIESKVVPPVDILPSRSKTESPAGCQNINNSTISQTIPIRLVSATYGPCDGRRLINGEWSNTEAVRIPYTRDVLPFLKTLLLQAQGNHQNSKKKNEKLIKCESANDVLMMENKEQENMNCMVSISNNSISGATTKSSSTPLGLHTPVPLIMEGKSMNAVFGDPCPGTTKLLRVQYYFGDSISSKEEDETNPANRRKRKKGQELCRATFFEHEEVVLKRKMTFFQKDVKTLKHEEDQERNNEKDDDSLSSHEDAFDSREACKPNLSSSSPILKSISRNYRSQSITEFEIEEQEEILMKSQLDKNKVHDNLDPNNLQSSPPRNMSPISTPLALSKNTSPPQPKKWRLRSATSEIVLPMILPYLPLLQRAQCQLVCKVWRFIVREWGVAQVVDVKRCHAHLTSTTSSSSNTADPTNNSTGQNRSIVTHDPIRSFLRGVISNSYSSLQSLFLNDYHQLTREDFHPLIPHLKKLKRLDISRCKHLNNYTLILISQHLNKTLEMLYMKGLPNASDVGVKAMVSACTKLRVLEISNVKITDTSAFAIGNHLTNLQALYMRDNWRLTSEGVNCITERCHNLTQLTLWGTVKMKSMGTFANMEGLVLLNLWGCHGLRDDCVANFGGLKCLRSLIVSECHGLTDRFVVSIPM